MRGRWALAAVGAGALVGACTAAEPVDVRLGEVAPPEPRSDPCVDRGG